MRDIERLRNEVEEEDLNDAIVNNFVERIHNHHEIQHKQQVLRKRSCQMEMISDILRKEFKIDLSKVASKYEIYKNCISGQGQSK
jgi:hypothetical protein